MSKMTGGISDNDEPATAEVQTLVEQVKDQITGKMNGTFEVFEAITFKSQVVAGRNYFVKIHVGNDKCIHARIYKNLQREVSVHSIQEDKTREDPITYF
ncbi:cystatin-B-like [Daphnia pulex]|uniref:cystatin-B-like n=1 Tax=Daphnia pulex TaxID=6669 RepID=UPI001EE14E35|nr:cystatin-B-like [Daphnia pulex]